MSYRTTYVSLGVFVFCALTQPVWGSISVTSQFFLNQDNWVSDNSAEFLVNRFGAPTKVDVGDILISAFRISTIEDLTGGGGEHLFGTAGVNEFTGLSVIQATSKMATMTPTIFDYYFGPVTAAGKKAMLANPTLAPISAEIATWAPGTMTALYDDPSVNYSRLSPPPDDLAPGPSPDVGIGPFAAESTVAGKSIDGTRILEIGMPAVPVGTNLFWSADDAQEDIGVLGALPAGVVAGDVSFGLDVTSNPLAPNLKYLLVGNFDPVPGPVGVVGTSQFFGTGNLRGKGAAGSPFDAFDDINVTFHPTPEPGSLGIWLLLGVSMIVAAHRFQRKRR